MKYLLDTCVISELIAKKPNPRVVNWIDRIDDQLISLSVITIGEVKRGIEKLPQSDRKEKLNNWLSDELLIRFDQRILGIDLPVMLKWGELVAELEGKGRSLPAIDSLIATITLTHDLKLVTRNERDFVGTGVAIMNPWIEEG